MTDPAKAAWSIVVDAARAAYLSPALADVEEWCAENGYELRYELADAITHPINTRCPGCGLYLDGCESGLCSQRHDEEENDG